MKWNKPEIGRSFERGLITLLITGGLITTLQTHAQKPTDPSSPADNYDQLLEYSQCIRENGFTEYPDPGPNGQIRLMIGSESGPKLRVAMEACRDRAPSGMPMLGQMNTNPEDIERMVNFAQCVRENGISDFPDPDSKGTFNVSANINPGSTRLQAVMKTCREMVGEGLFLRLNFQK